jgi:hypothetical protein
VKPGARLLRGSFPYFASEGWWARQDSNLQPDRYEREDNGQFRRLCYGFIRFRPRSLRFVDDVSGAKPVRQRGKVLRLVDRNRPTLVENRYKMVVAQSRDRLSLPALPSRIEKQLPPLVQP